MLYVMSIWMLWKIGLDDDEEVNQFGEVLPETIVWEVMEATEDETWCIVVSFPGAKSEWIDWKSINLWKCNTESNQYFQANLCRWRCLACFKFLYLRRCVKATETSSVSQLITLDGDNLISSHQKTPELDICIIIATSAHSLSYHWSANIIQRLFTIVRKNLIIFCHYWSFLLLCHQVPSRAVLCTLHIIKTK